MTSTVTPSHNNFGAHPLGFLLQRIFSLHRAAAAAPVPLVPEAAAMSIARLLEEKTLRAHYQPIARLDNGAVVAHESLIRLPAGHALRNPDELFQAAREQGLLVRLEQACVDEGTRTWSSVGGGLAFFELERLCHRRNGATLGRWRRGERLGSRRGVTALPGHRNH